MQQTQGTPTNRCFSAKPQPISKEEEVKKLLAETKARRDAEAQLKNLLLQFRGKKSLLQLLPVIKLRFPSILKLAIERARESIKRKKPKGEREKRQQLEQLMELGQFEASLTE